MSLPASPTDPLAAPSAQPQQFFCAACLVPEGQPHLLGCPVGDLRIEVEKAMAMLEQLDLPKLPLAAGAVSILNAALWGASARNGVVVVEQLFSSAELAALRRFNEACKYGQRYDVPWQMMMSLAEVGAVRRLGITRRFEFTEFGRAVIACAVAPAPSGTNTESSS